MRYSYFAFFIFALIINVEQLKSQNIIINNFDTSFAQYKIIDNQGIYGGEFIDVAFSHKTSRIFAGVNSLTSLYYSDDTASTWHSAFDTDSLYTNNGKSGWIGSVDKVLTNDSGWVLARSSIREYDLFGSEISFNNGDAGSWKTAMNKATLVSMGYLEREISAIALTNYHAYVALGNYIVTIDTSPIDTSLDVIDISKQNIPGIDSSYKINSLAVANKQTGYPLYFTLLNNTSVKDTLLYKYDGITFTQVVCPADVNKLIQVYLPSQLSGDTIFLAANDSLKNKRIYWSSNGGSTWNDISYPLATSYLMDVDYSENWKVQYPASNGIILFIPNSAYSIDIGASWETIAPQFKAIAFFLDDMNSVIACYKKSAFGSNGITGTLVDRRDVGLNTLKIHQIRYWPTNENIAYAASQVGLGYTTALTDTTIATYLKWESPYGKITADAQEFTAVAIEPTNADHIIAGSYRGFWLSTKNVDSLKWLNTNGFEIDSVIIKDMLFIDSVTIAVTASIATDLNKGDIWRSVDGGQHWIIVSPTGFNNGNTIAKLNDSVIYVGSGIDSLKGYLWKSVDRGLNWFQVNTGPSDLNDASINSLPINDIAIKGSSDTLYIAAGNDTGSAFVVSYDGGTTYHYIEFQNADKDAFTAVAINKNNSDSVFFAEGNATYLYNVDSSFISMQFKGIVGEETNDLSLGSILVGSTTGFYTVNMEPFDDITLVSIIDTKKQTQSLECLEFPNPIYESNQLININCNIKDKNIIAELYNLVGQKLQQYTITKQTQIIELPALKTGIYLIRYRTDHNLFEQKIIVQ